MGVGCGCIIINDKDEILLMKRKTGTKLEKGMWSRPGGTLEFGETAEETVKREIKEELGIDIEVKFHDYSENIVNEDGKHWVALGFIGKIISGEPKNLEPHKHEEIKWFPLNNLPEDLSSYTKNAIEIYKNKL